MRVKMIKTDAGPDGSYTQGHEYTVSNEKAQELFGAGAAVPVKSAAVERGVSREAEAAETQQGVGGSGQKKVTPKKRAARKRKAESKRPGGNSL
ncbi:MAG: hypothetical protein CMN85_10875 [Spongiibacteraceae bacterium]|uniref:hypothetical protein n=1 Tax=uncultured Haliea sp. TaxID=622616 RepID=UPI000C4D6933|nr:hypothetical protein [Spongiibacteraceae bacterium]|tara:strand:+ start:22358 stop:22639 length:282 start_codon:yes stop_codon:yes gene_type:complete